MTDEIIILDGSRKLHVDNTLQVLKNIENLRNTPQRVWKSWDQNFINSLITPAYNPNRNQVDVYELGAQMSLNRWLHRENAAALKVVLMDQDMYDSRRSNMNFGYGVNLPFESGSTYAVISTARLKDEAHARHVLAHELGHAFGAPNSSRRDIYESLGAHCGDKNCTMHQELNGESYYEQALRIVRLGRDYCSSCTRDIQRFVK